MKEKEFTPEQIRNLEIVRKGVLQADAWRRANSKTPITREWLTENGFKQIKEFNTYHLAIDLKLSNVKAWIDASLLPHDIWMATYVVNGHGASKVMKTTEEIEILIKAIS